MTHTSFAHMAQDTMNFWEFQITVQSMNAVLQNTLHYLENDKFQEIIEARMHQFLYVQATNAKLYEVKDFRK